MKNLVTFSLLTVLLVATSTPCFALRFVSYLSKERAKALGIEIRTRENGPQTAWVDLEFKAEGELKDYGPEHRSRVQLRLLEGDRELVNAVLAETHPKPGHVSVGFSAHRSQLEKITLTVVVGEGGMTGGSYELRLRDFVEPNRTR